MNNWKVILEHNGTITELFIKAKSFSDAYINSELSYPDHRVVSISLCPEIIIEKNGEHDDN